MTTKHVRVIVAVADTIVRAGLSKLLADQMAERIEVTECNSLQELMSKPLKHSQLVMIDADLHPDFKLLSRLGSSGTPVILMNPGFPVPVSAYVESGVRGILFRPISRDGLRVALETVWSGDIYVGPISSELAVAEATPKSTRSLLTGRLTDRETEVVENVYAGCSNQEIAERLCLSISTVKSHLRRIMQKASAHDRISLINKLHLSFE